MIGRLLGWDRPRTESEIAALELDEMSRRMLHDFVTMICEGLGFRVTILAVVEPVGEEDRLTVKAYASGNMEETTGKSLLNNYVVVNAETEQINRAVAAIRQEKDYDIVDNLYDLFAPRINREAAAQLQTMTGIKRVITVPFRDNRGVLIGNLYAAREVEDVPESLINQLRAFSGMATMLMENVSLRYQALRMTGREDVLKDTITQMLSDTINQQRLLQNIVNSVVNKLGFRGSMLSVVRHHEGKRILPVTAYQFVDELNGLIEAGERLAGMRLRGGWVYVDEETARTNVGVRTIIENLPSAKTDKLSDLFSPVIPATMAGMLQGMFRIRTLATVPLWNKNGELRGNLFAATDRDDISAAEIEDLKTFALAASIAIENAQHIRETQRMGLLASSIAHLVHRLNGLLGGARWDVDRLITELDMLHQDSILAPRLGQVYEHIDHSVKMIQGLHDRVYQPVTTAVDGDNIIDVNAELHLAYTSLETMHGYRKPPGIRVTEKYCREKPFVLATEELREVFRILIKNAYEAMDESGSLRITTQIVAAQHGGQGERAVQIMISDTGEGIPLNGRERLFDLSPSFKNGGLGYGLWSARLTVEWFEGHITFTSLTEEEIAADSALRGRKPGTTFIITLPLIDIKDDADRLQTT